MARTILLYALALAAATAALEWLQYRYVTRAFAPEISVALIGAACVALGVWAGARLAGRGRREGPFARNDAAIRALGLTPRECEILESLAAGESNKEMARRLGVSPNTIKTHLARVYDKLEVRRRVQAIEKARSLALIE